jgi:protein O-GlcNAc transferase
LTVQELFQSGLAHHNAGRLGEAEGVYRRVLGERPDHADALHMLGVVAAQVGRMEAATELISRAVGVSPSIAEYHLNLCKVLISRGIKERAIEEALEATRLEPGLAFAHCLLGVALAGVGKMDEAIAAVRRSIQINPADAEAHNALGSFLPQKGEFEEAISCFRAAIQLNPANGEYHRNLGLALGETGRSDEAIAALERAITLQPKSAAAYGNLGTRLLHTGRVDEAIALLSRAVELNPRDAVVGSNLVFAAQFHPGLDGAARLRLAREWADRHENPAARFRPAGYRNERSADRRLRVGFVSGDFRRHAVGIFMMPLLEHHDRGAVEMVCYSNSHISDDLTERLKSGADGWRDIRLMSDEQAAFLVENDGIDILVDLSMHTALNRLTLFARKPAPVQATYLAYPGTTGMEAIDYRITDPFLDPAGSGDGEYSEKSIWLPETYWCYSRLGDVAVRTELPARRGFATFGCLNNFAKVNDKALELWAGILREVAGSRLVLHAHEGVHRERARRVMDGFGVDAGRVSFQEYLPLERYLEAYHEIDIVLDPFPFSGGTTTCDALWMGAPVVTLRGASAISRGGASILNNVGLGRLVAGSGEEYRRIAVELGEDLEGLENLRGTLRERMVSSPLMDGGRFARNMEKVFREMWNNACITASWRSW